MRRRTLLINSSGGSTNPSQAAPLEVAFYDGSDIVIRKQEDWQDDETPIGIVVVPGYHDRYGDGSCGIMSLVGMDYNHPETGIPVTSDSQTDNVTMNWGHLESTVGNNIFSSSIGIITSGYEYIPYQKNNESTACTINGGNTVWPYGGTTTAPTSAASTSYSNTGGYVQATSGKAGCDFNGIRNTVACYVKTRTAPQWTASTVPNVFKTTNTPPAACCGRFKTVGTQSFLDVFSGITSNDLSYGTPTSTKANKGFWYLPAYGELCYLLRYRFEINKTIFALNQKYGNVGVQLNTQVRYWTSSVYFYGSLNSWVVTMVNGYLTNTMSNDSLYVRAFMRL